MKKPRKIIASGIGYLDPLDCGSTVGYRIRHGRHGINADVDLTDCNRKIEWYFDNNAAAIKKINNAIEILTKFRSEFSKACRRKQK